jgi:hypothetical protein
VTLTTPFTEELVFRGVVFRILEEVLGGWLALVLSSVAFGLMHTGNPGETFAGIAAIAIVFGPMLAVPYMLTRRLWMGIGLHGAWNFTMGQIFPAPCPVMELCMVSSKPPFRDRNYSPAATLAWRGR